VRAWPFVLVALCASALAQEREGTHELIGQVGSRAALLTLHATRNADASWQLAGEYVVLRTQQRRYVEGESSPELGVTTLREGATPILFGRAPSAELRGVWRAGTLRGMRYGPAGQERERFEFSEEFPSLSTYSASVRCEADDRGYRATLSYAVEAGKVQSFEWRARAEPGGESCQLANLTQEPMQGGIRLASGQCLVTLRDLGESLRVAASGCTVQCQAPATLVPLLVDRRGGCELFRPQVR